ncbi:MAG: hypothetical protein ACRDOH_11945 [Streptosporangiaceae bacterium]
MVLLIRREEVTAGPVQAQPDGLARAARTSAKTPVSLVSPLMSIACS